MLIVGPQFSIQYSATFRRSIIGSEETIDQPGPALFEQVECDCRSGYGRTLIRFPRRNPARIRDRMSRMSVALEGRLDVGDGAHHPSTAQFRFPTLCALRRDFEQRRRVDSQILMDRRTLERRAIGADRVR